MADNKNVTQTTRILNHLLDEGSISGVEAWAMYKSRSLTKRINELRALGYDIKSEWKTDHTGQRYVRYWLRKKEPAKDPVKVPVKNCFKKAGFDEPSEYRRKFQEFKDGNSKVVSHMFVWAETPQGHTFWDEVWGGQHRETALSILELWDQELNPVALAA